MSICSDRSGSTSSLFSILDHESFDEDNPSSSECEEFVVISPVRVTNNSLDNGKEKEVKSLKPEPEPESEPESANESPKSADDSGEKSAQEKGKLEKPPLSAWEKWFIEKMEKERQIKRKQERLKKKQALAEAQEKKDKEVAWQRLKEDAEAKKKIQERKALRQLSSKKSNLSEEKRKVEETRQKAVEEYQSWTLKKRQELSKEKELRKQRDSVLKQVSAQKTLLAHQAFNDWLLTKNLTQDRSPSRNRFFSSPRPSVSLPEWRGRGDLDNLPFDFSTRLFINNSQLRC